jgi:hypothetical protein
MLSRLNFRAHKRRRCHTGCCRFTYYKSPAPEPKREGGGERRRLKGGPVAAWAVTVSMPPPLDAFAPLPLELVYEPG